MSQNRHRIGDYLNHTGDVLTGLTPDAAMLREVAYTDWWTVVSEHFGMLIYQYWMNRTVLMDEFKYPYNMMDPDNTSDMDTTIQNIKQSFAINLRVNARKYEKMFKVFMSEYDPLYNVDAHEFEDRTLSQTGTDINSKSGTDSTTRSGNSEIEKLGTEASTRTGSEQMSHTGSDTTLTQKTTYDSADFRDTDKSTITPGVTDTSTYNNVKDEQSFNGRKDKTTYNDIKDETAYGSSDTNTKNLLDTEHIERRRYGNIGVTKSSELLIDALKESEITGNFIYNVVHDCINTCTYMVE
jgi:hypothetical protein